jgi:hypothetical protein
MSGVYNKGKDYVMKNGLTGETLKAMLVNSGYSFDPDHDFVADLTPGSNELSGTGYAAGFSGAGRKTLGSAALAEDDTNDRSYADYADLTWTAINAGTAAALVLYISKTSDADSILLGYVNSGGFPKVTNGGDLVVQWSSSPLGVLQIS